METYAARYVLALYFKKGKGVIFLLMYCDNIVTIMQDINIFYNQKVKVLFSILNYI